MDTFEDASKTLQSLQAQLKNLAATDGDKRKNLLEEARKLVKALESPEEVVFRQSFETYTYSLCIRLAVDLGIFHILVGLSGQSIRASDLAVQCGAEKLLVVRIMRILTALDYAGESAECEYVATPLSYAATKPHLEAYIVHSYENAARVANRMPEYFRLHGYQCPTDGKNGPFQYALDTPLAYFDYLHKDPVKMKRFNICIKGHKGMRRYWVDWFPVHDYLLESFTASDESNKNFLVDMGGGTGHHLEALLRKFPESSGHLVLQDLPGTIDSLTSLAPGIQPMVHDIFSPQTITGAKAYYTHALLHDFPDDQCRTILRHVAKAMKPGYSHLLLNEIIIPAVACPTFFAAIDITMMACLAGMQRSKDHWIELVESAGLTVKNVWNSPDDGDYEGVIEAVLTASVPALPIITWGELPKL